MAVSSKRALDGKVVGLYFEAADKYMDEDDSMRSKRSMLLEAMKYVHKALGVVNKDGDFDAGEVEFVYLTAASSVSDFHERFSQMPWLALPFTADLRREQLRSLFDATDEADKVVLIGVEGDTITRNGAALLGLAYTLQAAENQAKRGSDNYMVKHMQDSLANLRKRLESDRNMLLPHGNAVDAAAKALDEGFARAADGDARRPERRSSSRSCSTSSRSPSSQASSRRGSRQPSFDTRRPRPRSTRCPSKSLTSCARPPHHRKQSRGPCVSFAPSSTFGPTLRWHNSG